MHVQYVALCDQVILSTEGRPTLVGVFNDLQVQTLPITLPRIAFAARLLFPSDELGVTRRVEVVISDPTGKEIGRPGGDLALPNPIAEVDSLAIDVPLQFDFFEIATSGRYTFLLHVDGKPTAAVQLAVRQAKLA
jgi:uncharacterized protein DUF6941